MTTGSTAAEIARVLRHAGAARVEVWVVARTPRPADR
jgi:predicted amidophosphoribosyltransferase